MKKSMNRLLFEDLYNADGWITNGDLATRISDKFCMSLNSRASDLRTKYGLDIECKPVDVSEGIYKYRLVTPRDQIDYKTMMILPPVATTQQVELMLG